MSPPPRLGQEETAQVHELVPSPAEVGGRRDLPSISHDIHDVFDLADRIKRDA